MKQGKISKDTWHRLAIKDEEFFILTKKVKKIKDRTKRIF